MNEVNEQPIPNLEEMDEQEAARFLTEGMSRMSPECPGKSLAAPARSGSANKGEGDDGQYPRDGI